MADYATKRVPLEPHRKNQQEFGEGPADAVDQSLEELRQLILRPEQEDLARLEERIDNREQRTQDVSEVLPEAIGLRREQGGERVLGEALAPSVEAALRESVRKNPGTLADALFPVMGPAIRRSILQTLRSLFDSFNKTMEQSLSLNGLKWRLEALRTGRPFSEVVLMHSLVFRVEQVLLIHQKTGLPLGHAVAPAVAIEDPGLVSGMLTAIQDFVRDSFNAAPGEVVEKLNVGELEVWVESGPYASIAAVIRGVGPPQLRTRLAETLELIHRNYSAEMERFAGETAGFAPVVELLSALLDSAYQQKPPPRAKPYAWVLLGVVLLALAGWLSLRWWQGRQWSRLARTLESEPGIVITGFGRQGGHLLVRGLRDPLARDPADLLRAAGLTDRQAEFHWNSYYALDDPIVRKRAMVLLEPPASVSLDAQDGVLVVSGEAPRPWIDKLREARLIAGVRRVDLSRLADLDEAEFRRAKAAIEATVLRFPVGSSEILSDAREELASLFPQFVELTKRSSVLHRPFAVEIIGHSDSSGAEATNRPLSQSRAERVRRQLAGQGLDLKRMQAKGVAATEPLRNEENEEARQYNRSVTIRIVPLGTPQL